MVVAAERGCQVGVATPGQLREPPPYVALFGALYSGHAMQAEWDFFLAHAGADADIAEELYELLSPHARVFLDSRCLVLGDDWDRQLAAAQRRSRATIVLVSSHTDTAYYEREEIAAAVDRARKGPHAHRVVPIYLDGPIGDDVDIPYGLRLKQGLSVADEQTLEAVAARLVTLLSRMNELSDGTVARSQGALQRLTAGKPRERLRGMQEVAGVYRPLQVTLLAIFAVDVLLLLGCVVSPGIDGFIDRTLAVTVLGATAAGVLFCLMIVFQKSVDLAREIVLSRSAIPAAGG